MLKKTELIQEMLDYKKCGLGVLLYMTIPTLKALEQVGVPNINIDNKVMYIQQVYNENLEHKNDSRIRIVKCNPMDFEDEDNQEIEQSLLGINRETKEILS